MLSVLFSHVLNDICCIAKTPTSIRSKRLNLLVLQLNSKQVKVSELVVIINSMTNTWSYGSARSHDDVATSNDFSLCGFNNMLFSSIKVDIMCESRQSGKHVHFVAPPLRLTMSLLFQWTFPLKGIICSSTYNSSSSSLAIISSDSRIPSCNGRIQRKLSTYTELLSLKWVIVWFLPIASEPWSQIQSLHHSLLL